jgi:hypothetical protein
MLLEIGFKKRSEKNLKTEQTGISEEKLRTVLKTIDDLNEESAKFILKKIVEELPHIQVGLYSMFVDINIIDGENNGKNKSILE